MNKIKLLCLFVIVLNFNIANAQNPNQQLINWFAGADIVGTSGDPEANLESDFYVREFELSAFSSIDQTFDGILTLAYHHELEIDEKHLEVHEAFLFSSKLFNLTNIKLGKFFLGFGRLNRFHRHDWIFTEAPMVQKSFFGTEGAKDTGVEFKRILPDLFGSITFGLTSGNEFNHTLDGHSHDDEEAGDHIEKAKAPTAYLRATKFFEFSTTEGIEIGINAISRRDQDSIAYLYQGVDFIYKDRQGRMINQLIQFEFWNRKTEDDGDKHQDFGAYTYFQKGIDQHHSWGARLDYYKKDEHSHEDDEQVHLIDGLEVDKELIALSLSYIYTNSEFMKTRATIEQGKGIHVDGEDTDQYTKGLLQLVFSIGAHPAHVY